MFNVEELATLHKAKVILLRKARTNARAFNDPGAVKQYLSIAHATNEPQRESFRILFLDNQHRLIADEVAFYGTIDASPVYPRVVVQKALEHNAAAIMLSHNHPSGIAEPSMADRNITNRLKDALALIDVRILDHFVIGDDNVVSFAERGWL